MSVSTRPRGRRARRSSAPRASQTCPVAFGRWPQDDDELWEFVYAMWNVQIPRVPVCARHVAPFTAFADAFFARDPVAIWKASRGFGGKSVLLAILGITEQVVLGAQVSILGGSGWQSQNVHETMINAWNQPRAPRNLLASAPNQRQTTLTNGGWARALKASQTSVRGPHPNRLRLDECDETPLPIVDAALGQPMRRGNIQPHVVLSSTHQYPNGTMTEMLKRVGTHGYRLYEWCYQENTQPHGWLTVAEIAQKRSLVTGTMWNAEYDLQDPSPENRAIQTEAVAEMFSHDLGTFEGLPRQYIEIEAPVKGGRYVHGGDWAKSVDWTEIITLRIDVRPIRLVAYERMQRLPWPTMVKRFDVRVQRYPGKAAHDGTGIGDVVDGYLSVTAESVVLVGRARADLFSEWINAIEQGDVVAPFITALESQYKYVTVGDLYGAGHPPDGFVAGAMAYYASGLGKHPPRPRIRNPAKVETPTPEAVAGAELTAV